MVSYIALHAVQCTFTSKSSNKYIVQGSSEIQQTSNLGEQLCKLVEKPIQSLLVHRGRFGLPVNMIESSFLKGDCGGKRQLQVQGFLVPS